MPITYLDSPKITYLDEPAQPMFKTEQEGRSALEKAKSFQRQAEWEASPVGFPVTQGLAVINRAINTATMNAPEIIANLAGQTTRPITESEFARSTGEAIGFVAPTGAPMRVIKAAEVIKNPLTRNVIQGAGAMATQLPTADRGIDEYNVGIGAGAVFGAAGRGVEKVASGAIQQAAKGVSGRIHDYLVKLPTGSYKFGKNPVKVAADEAIVANNMADYEKIAAERLAQRSQQLEAAIQNSNQTVDIDEMVNKYLASASKKLSGSLKDRSSKIDELNTVRDNLVQKYGDLKNISVQDAIKLKRQLADDFPFTQEGAGDITTKAAHRIYHDINGFIERAHPEIAALNERVSGLIDIRNAARNRNAIEMRQNPIGMVGRLAGIGAAGVGFGAGAPVEGIIAGLGIMGVEKAIQSPAVLTRLAKALSALSGQDRIKVLEAFPKLKTAIKVDARDVEIIPPKQKTAIPSKVGSRQDIIDVSGKTIYPEKMIQSGKQNLMLEDLGTQANPVLKEGQIIPGEGFTVTPYSTKEAMKKASEYARKNAEQSRSIPVTQEMQRGILNPTGENIKINIPISKKSRVSVKKGTKIPSKAVKVSGGVGAAGMASSSVQAKTIGAKNNNPVNIKQFSDKDPWEGTAGKDEYGHVIFETPDHGLRAAIKNAENRKKRMPNQSLNGWLNQFAEKNGTHEAKYIAGKMGITIDEKLKNINMRELIKHLAWFESRSKITDDDINRVVKKFKL